MKRKSLSGFEWAWKVGVFILTLIVLLLKNGENLPALPSLDFDDISFQDLQSIEYTLTSATLKDIGQNSDLLLVKTSQGRYAKLKVTASGLEGIVYNADGTKHLDISLRFEAFKIIDLDTGQLSDVDGDIFIDNQGSQGMVLMALNGTRFALADALIPSQFGTLSVASDPDSAYVFVDGAYRGETFGRSFEFLLRKGTHQLKVAKPGFADARQTVVVTADERKELSFNLEPLPKAEPKWSFRSLSAVQASPVLGDLNQDGSLDVIVASEIGTVYALTAAGEGLWATKLNSELAYPPAIGDVNADGQLEIVIVDKKNYLYLLDREGKVLWRVFPSNRSFTGAPILADMDGDGHLEIIFSTTEQVYVLNAQGGVLWSEKIEGEADYLSPPAVGDLDGDGRPEIVVLSRSRTTKKLYVLEANGEILDQRQEEFSYNATPILGDLNGNGKAEIVVAANFVEVQALTYPLEPLWETQPHSFAATTARFSMGDLEGDGSVEVLVTSDRWIYALNARGEVRWQYQTDHRLYSAPTLADLDGDGRLEVLVSTSAGRVLAFSAEGDPLWTFETDEPILSSPVVGDLDGDGKFELLVGSDDFSLYALPAPAKGRVAWDGPGGSPRHTGSAQDALEYGRAVALGPQATALWTLGLPFNNTLPPVAAFTYDPANPLTRDTISFDASASQDDGQIAEYRWDFGDGSSAAGVTTSHNYADNGKYTVSLTVTDDDGLSATATQTLAVANTPPSASFSYTPQGPLVLDTLEFTAQAEDSDGEIVSWEWELGDGTQASGPQVFHRYEQGGKYVVRMTVTDDDGDAVTAGQTLTVRSLRPASERPILRVEPLMLEFEGRVGGFDPPPQALSVTIEGEGVFQWKAAADVDWITLGAGQGALSGGRSIELMILVRAQGLTEGVHQGTITVEVDGAQGSPARLPVRLSLKKKGES